MIPLVHQDHVQLRIPWKIQRLQRTTAAHQLPRTVISQTKVRNRLSHCEDGNYTRGYPKRCTLAYGCIKIL